MNNRFWRGNRDGLKLDCCAGCVELCSVTRSLKSKYLHKSYPLVLGKSFPAFFDDKCTYSNRSVGFFDGLNCKLNMLKCEC
jgi:hypothetical protein